MSLETLVRDRRTVHDYQAEPVDWGKVQQALELGLWSMNHKLTFPWRYFRLGSEARHKIAEVMVELNEAKKGPLSEAMKTSLRSKILNPAEVVFIGQKWTPDEFQRHEDYATLSGSVHITCLMLWAEQIASKWSTGAFTRSPKTYEILGVRTDEVILQGCLFLGVPQRIPSPTERPHLNEVLKEIP